MLVTQSMTNFGNTVIVKNDQTVIPDENLLELVPSYLRYQAR